MKALKHISYYLLSLTAVIAAMSSCSDEFTEGLTATKDPHYLNADKSSLTFNSNRSTQQLGVQSTGVNWTLSNSAKWIELSQTSGSENASVGVTVAANDEYSDKGRAATMTLSGSGATTRNITVNQESPSLSLTVSPASVELSAAAGSKADVTVTCNNTAWTISVADDSWLTATKNGDMVTITASENTTGASRSNTVSVSSGSKIETIKVTQKAANITSSSESLSFGHAAGSQSFTVTSDVSWTIVTNSSWIDVSPKNGSVGTMKVNVAVTQNTSKENRTGTFTIGTKEVKVTQEGVILSASPTSFEFAEAGETLPLTITSNTKWKLTATSSDISFSKAEGEDNATVNVTMPENTATVKREIITLETTDGSNQSLQISVSQNGSGITDINSLDAFASEGGSIVYSVPSLSNWVAEVPSAYASWIHITPVKGSKDDSMTITVNKTTELTDREGYINLTYDYGAKYRINVKQYGAGIITSVSSYQFFAKGGTSDAITVQSNGTVKTSTSASWLTAKLNGNLLTITAAENLTGKARSGKVTLSLSGSSQKVEIAVTQANQHGDFLINDYGDEKDLLFVEPEAVDLGLPSGTLWATFNVGATAPEEAGLYFAWGETTGYTSNTSDGRSFDWASYKWCNGSMTTMTKYCSDSKYGIVDNKTKLESADDAATANWGKDWCMPTYAQQQELINSNCTTTTWTTQNGVNGRLITSKSNGKSIFLPASGWRNYTRISEVGYQGSYWSSEKSSNNSTGAYVLYCYPSSFGTSYDNTGLGFGRSVRAVRVAE